MDSLPRGTRSFRSAWCGMLTGSYGGDLARAEEVVREGKMNPAPTILSICYDLTRTFLSSEYPIISMVQLASERKWSNDAFCLIAREHGLPTVERRIARRRNCVEGPGGACSSAATPTTDGYEYAQICFS